jgi:virginiamycin B lyase
MRIIGFAALLSVGLSVGACSERGITAAGKAPDMILTGSVSSQAEGPMEGVLVGAKKENGGIKVTVVSDHEGHFSFPKGTLPPGKYQLSIRAAGYDLTDSGSVEIESNGSTAIDLKLKPTSDLAPQLMNAEWLASIGDPPDDLSGYRGAVRNVVDKGPAPDAPGTGKTRLDMFDKDRCSMCHSLYFVMRNGHDVNEWVEVLNRMRYHAQGGSPIHPDDAAYSPRVQKYWGQMEGGSTDDWTEEAATVPEGVIAQAKYLASINRSAPDGRFRYKLKTFPRPKGDETKVIITEYDLPRSDSEPHDAVVDADGMIWYQDFGQDFLGRLNPRTGEVKEWQYPAVRPFPPFAGGGLDVDLDGDGNPWITTKFRGGLIKFDKRTEKFTIWDDSDRNSLRTFITMATYSPSTKMMWFQVDGMAHGLDLTTNQITKRFSLAKLGMYDFMATGKGNLVVLGFSTGAIHLVDTNTGQAASFPTPSPNSAPRRGHVDTQDRAWFGEYWAGKIGMFDTTTKEIKEWPLSVPFADPYDVILDKHGEAWGGGMLTDYVYRLDPPTGHVTKYLLPTVNANIRRIDVDNSMQTPNSWVGENHQGKIARIEVRP